MKDFVPHKESLQLAELGFDELVFAKYQKMSEGAKYQLQLLAKERNCNILDTAISAPTFSQAFRFFREKYPDLGFGVGKIYNHKYHYHINLEWRFYQGTYEEAELELLKELIKYAKTN